MSEIDDYESGLQERLAAWTAATADGTGRRDGRALDYRWQTEVAGQRWRIQLNDFPDDVMYTLLIDDREVGSFHDWPASWQRPRARQ